MLPDCFDDQTIMSVHSTQEIYDGCLAAVKAGNTFVTGFCSDPSQTAFGIRFEDINRSTDR